jgi:hypothetical protein
LIYNKLIISNKKNYLRILFFLQRFLQLFLQRFLQLFLQRFLQLFLQDLLFLRPKRLPVDVIDMGIGIRTELLWVVKIAP